MRIHILDPILSDVWNSVPYCPLWWYIHSLAKHCAMWITSFWKHQNALNISQSTNFKSYHLFCPNSEQSLMWWEDAMSILFIWSRTWTSYSEDKPTLMMLCCIYIVAIMYLLCTNPDKWTSPLQYSVISSICIRLVSETWYCYMKY